MSLAIITTTNEGNILSADSMETYRNIIGDTREGSESRMKIFQLNKRVGCVACGISFLENKNVQQQIQVFKKHYDLENLKVLEIVNLLYDFFFEKYQKHLIEVAEKRKKEYIDRGFKNIEYSIDLERILIEYKDINGKINKSSFSIPIMELLVAGYDEKDKNNVYKIAIPDPKDSNGIVNKMEDGQCGATWIGQTEVLIRIIRGWSPEIKKLRVIEELPEKKREELLRNLDDQEYLINWGTMTIQDAIDFSMLAIKTTAEIQKITDGTWGNPGSSPGVGGPIDVAVITPEKGFIWAKKKNLKIEDTVVKLDDFPDIKVQKNINNTN